MEYWQLALNIVTVLLGGGGLVAWIKARSEVRNNNKSADIAALEQTINTLQNSYRELQDRYQEVIKENDERCNKLSERLQYLEIEYVKQTQENAERSTKITQLESRLKEAQHRIETLECELRKRDTKIMRLEQENIELRRLNGHRVGLEE